MATVGGKISIPNGYDLFSTDNEFTEEMCQRHESGFKQMNQYLSMSSFDMLIIPKDESIVDNDFAIYVKVKSEKDYGIDNLMELNEDDLSIFAQTLVTGFGVSDYKIVESDNVKYVVFDVKIKDYQRRYATIVNGKMVYFYYDSVDSVVSDDRADDLKTIAFSLKY